MQRIVNQIVECSYTGFFRSMFLKLKVEELLMMLLAPCFRAMEVSKTFFKISDEQIKKIDKARKYVEENLTRAVTIKELSKEVGLSQLKIKDGFKILFGKTVFEYSLRHRMDYATQLLLKGQSVNEVYPQVGYANQASFSYAFKNCTGITPTRVKKMKEG
ncbi:AraC family transcriptional regulator [Weeksellaceae bacterium TAE3-ERU29]|nr:AraC family transcriptional regulator [Weeksellaceae bacterium TAE3-ERU29]